MAKKIDFAARARALVGTRFRPQGRGVEGLDCLGLVIRAYDIDASSVRRDYRLRGDHRDEILAHAKRYFRGVRNASAGDLLLLQAGREQVHFAVVTDAGFVHADAGIGRVVETPGAPPWPVIAAFRRRRTGKKD